MSLPLQFVGALLLTFFISRITVRLPLPSHEMRRLLIAHAIAFVLAGALIMFVRGPHGHFSPLALAPVLAMQFVWLLIDRARHNLPAWD